MSRSRRWLVFLLVFVVGVGVLWCVAHFYLSSQHITQQVASRLQALYGAPVELREASLGLRGSSLRDLQFFEADPSSAVEPWLVIGQAQADMPLWALVKS